MSVPFRRTRPFLIGLLLIAPLVWTVGYDLNLYWVIFAVGLVAGGNAVLRELPRLWDYCRYSSVCRWSVGLIVWSVIAFVAYPFYALSAGLPLAIHRALVSVLTAMVFASFFFLGLRCARDPVERDWVYLGLVVCGVLHMAYLGWISYRTGWIVDPQAPELRALLRQASPTWPSRYPVDLLTLVPICGLLAARGVHRTFAVWAAMLFAAAVIWSLTRGAWVGLAVGCLTLVLYRLPGWKAVALAAVVSVIISAGSPTMQARFWLMFPRNGTFESSTALRLAIWRDSMAAVLRSPVVGYGQQGTGVILGIVESELDVVSGTAAHNDYIDMAIRAGLPALALYLLIVAAVLRFGFRLSIGPRDEQVPAYVAVALAGAFTYGFFHELLRQPVAGSLVWYLLGNISHQQAVWTWKRADARNLVTNVIAEVPAL